MNTMEKSCPDVLILAGWLEGSLSPQERARMESHLAGCDEATGAPDCRLWTGTGNTVGESCFFTTDDVYSGDPVASGISPGFPGKYATVAKASSPVVDPGFADRLWPLHANRSYRILKYNLQEYWRDQNQPTNQPFPEAFDLIHPDLHFAKLAEGQGVDAIRVERPEQITPALDRALMDDRPFLIDLVLSSEL